MTRRAALLLLAAAVSSGVGPASPALAQGRSLAVRVERGGSPLVIVPAVLDDEALREAVRSGLPLRMRFSLELWKDEWFDDLVAQRNWSRVMLFEPLERQFLVAGSGLDTIARFAEYDDARAVLEGAYRAAVGPTERGRYYYLVYLEVETLSLSDLDELQRWLSGQLRPAVEGQRSIADAVGAGAKRLLIRVLDLPARRFQGRSPRFDIP